MLPTPALPNQFDYERVYEPAEDTFLLLDCLEQEKPFLDTFFKGKLPTVLEVGTGSGTITTFANLHILKGLFLATDINRACCDSVLETHEINGGSPLLDTLQCSLVDSLRDNCVDVLIFNPPYVPNEGVPQVPANADDHVWLDLALVGGNDGMVVTWKLLSKLDRVLTVNGVAYILFCARNKPEQVVETFKQSYPFKVELVIHRKAGWEELSVYKFIRN